MKSCSSYSSCKHGFPEMGESTSVELLKDIQNREAKLLVFPLSSWTKKEKRRTHREKGEDLWSLGE